MGSDSSPLTSGFTLHYCYTTLRYFLRVFTKQQSQYARTLNTSVGSLFVHYSTFSPMTAHRLPVATQWKIGTTNGANWSIWLTFPSLLVGIFFLPFIERWTFDVQKSTLQCRDPSLSYLSTTLHTRTLHLERPVSATTATSKCPFFVPVSRIHNDNDDDTVTFFLNFASCASWVHFLPTTWLMAFGPFTSWSVQSQVSPQHNPNQPKSTPRFAL